MQRQRTNSTNQPAEQAKDDPVTQQLESYHPDESRRRELARQWLRVARGGRQDSLPFEVGQ